MARIESAGASDVGRVRRENQDAFGEFASERGERLLVVADGMGGHRGGSTASHMCIETIGRVFAGPGSAEERLRRGFALANAHIHEVAEADPELSGMGTTAVALALAPEGDVALAWVGDSRAYRLRAGALEQLTADHSIVGELVRAGELTPAAAETHARRNELTRALGTQPSIDVDLLVLRKAPGDRFLLCTDGLWGSVAKNELAALLADSSLEAAVNALIARANQCGGPDNATAVVVRVEGETETRRTVPMGPALIAAVGALLALLVGWCAGAARADSDPTRRSFYLPMRDGVPIAVDLHLPDGAGEDARVPAMLRMTRYWRAVRFRALVRPLLDEPSPLARSFLSAGYAWLDVDVRGSGASGGVQRSLWSDDEVRDGAEIVDWIVRQPWSSGRVGALGDSYDGTAAELLLANRHPAVRAVAPRFALFDGYADIGFPGGVHLTWFTETWGRFNDAIDRGALFGAFPAWVPLFISGPRPVDGPDGARGVLDAQRAHGANFDVHAAALATPFRDDPAPGVGLRTADWSPYGVRRAAIEASGAAVFSYSGWLDGGYAHAAIKRFRTLANPGQRLLLGPWNHGGDQHLEPLEATRESEFDHAAELLRFFDAHLKNAAGSNGAAPERPVRWYTTGAKRWNEAASWPPPAEPRRLYLAADGALAAVPEPAPAGADEYATDPEAGTGDTSRWRGLAVPTWTEYPDRAEQGRHLRVYESAPLASDLEVTGHPLVQLTARCDQSDGTLFAYLEDVDPRGRVGYVSEGALRASLRRVRPAGEAPYALSVPYHSFDRADAEPLVPGQATELVFDLQPVSHRFRRGHRVRLALAGADRDQFAQLPGPPPVWSFERGAGSWLELPVVPPP